MRTGGLWLAGKERGRLGASGQGSPVAWQRKERGRSERAAGIERGGPRGKGTRTGRKRVEPARMGSALRSKKSLQRGKGRATEGKGRSVTSRVKIRSVTNTLR